MVIEIEYYKGNTLLIGKVKNKAELKKQIDVIQDMYDRITDNFIELLCRNYQWSILEACEKPDYIYDRDIDRLIKNKF